MELRKAFGRSLFLLLCGVPGQLDAQTEWDRALENIERLQPAAFTGLPEPVRRRLTDEGCRIPQPGEPSNPHNVIRGHFASPEQEDWAALCSRSDTSAILVIWGGPARCPAEVAASPDRNWLQGWGPGRIIYSRLIRRVGRDAIHSVENALDGAPPDRIDHDGIDDAFMGKASDILYCHNGRWIRLPGSD